MSETAEMVERVARALARADLDEETAMAVDLDAHMAFVSEHYQGLARAAIEAMKHPTDGMVKAAAKLKSPCVKYSALFNAMIDAALATPAPERT